jgi:DNA-binding response OmpR family regulator
MTPAPSHLAPYDARNTCLSALRTTSQSPSIRQNCWRAWKPCCAVCARRAEVTKAGIPVNLAAKELQLLRYLVDHRERVVSREEIMQEVWEYNRQVSSRTIDVHVAWLRQKLEDHPQNPQHIQTIRGRGYRFTA